MSNVIYKAYGIPNPSETSISRSVHKLSSPYTSFQFLPRYLSYDDYRTITDTSTKIWLLVYKITVGEPYLLPTEVPANSLNDYRNYTYGGNHWQYRAMMVKDWVRGNTTQRKFDHWNEEHVRSVAKSVIDDVINVDANDVPTHRADVRRVLNGVIDMLEDGDVSAAHYELYRLKESTAQHVNVGTIYTKADAIFKKLYAFYPWLDVTRTGNEDAGADDWSGIPLGN